MVGAAEVKHQNKSQTVRNSFRPEVKKKSGVFRQPLPFAACGGRKLLRSRRKCHQVPSKVLHQWPPSSTTCMEVLPEQCCCRHPHRSATRSSLHLESGMEELVPGSEQEVLAP